MRWIRTTTPEGHGVYSPLSDQLLNHDEKSRGYCLDPSGEIPESQSVTHENTLACLSRAPQPGFEPGYIGLKGRGVCLFLNWGLAPCAGFEPAFS